MSVPPGSAQDARAPKMKRTQKGILTRTAVGAAHARSADRPPADPRGRIADTAVGQGRLHEQRPAVPRWPNKRDVFHIIRLTNSKLVCLCPETPGQDSMDRKIEYRTR